MEDLTNYPQVFDQVTDTPEEAYTRKISLEVAGMHTKFWESDVLKEDWLHMPDDRYICALHDAAIDCANKCEEFNILWTKSFGHPPWKDNPSSIKYLTEVITGEHGPAILEYVYDNYTSRPWN